MDKEKNKFDISVPIYEPKRSSRFKLREALLLHEGLIMTYSVDRTSNVITKLGVLKDYIRVNYDNNTPKFNVFIKNDKEFFNKLSQKFDMCGWFFSDAETNDSYHKDINDAFNSKSEYFWVGFSPKFDVEISDTERPEFVYHVTTKAKLDNILKIGLTPKSGGKRTNHPDRIYFMLGRNEVIIRQLINELFNSNNSL